MQPWPISHALSSKAGRSPSRSTLQASNLQPDNLQTLAYWPRDRFQADNLQTFNPSNLQPFKPSTLQTFNPSNLQPFKPSTFKPSPLHP
ncbi:hypothetical protein BJP36_42340 [Moorena producens JHB]|uniref:Uncharacterized protein n=1 Tax=Moorena producens (strain JHB) TaxID=1454205 RepID=A0A9Q9UVN0_MOOP1|nr:hypothetical protein [Moorena producens]WAN69005.1 hypothetical protein BJP36_42340 [Moorena producens JHB]